MEEIVQLFRAFFFINNIYSRNFGTFWIQIQEYGMISGNGILTNLGASKYTIYQNLIFGMLLPIHLGIGDIDTTRPTNTQDQM